VDRVKSRSLRDPSWIRHGKLHRRLKIMRHNDHDAGLRKVLWIMRMLMETAQTMAETEQYLADAIAHLTDAQRAQLPRMQQAVKEEMRRG